MATHETKPDIISSGAGLAAAVALESGPELGEGTEPVRARGYWEQVWLRFRKDKIAIAGGVFIILIILAGFIGAPIAAHILGHGPGDLFTYGLDPNTQLPVGPMTHISLAPYVGATGDFGTTLLVLGGDSQLGRDEFLRLLYGTQVSLEVAIGATILEHVRRRADGLDGRLLRRLDRHDRVAPHRHHDGVPDPALHHRAGQHRRAAPRRNHVRRIFERGVVTLVLILGFFGWYYPARIVRAQVLSLREKEFIEAARMVGSSDWRIIRSHLVPHLVAPIIVLSTITVAQFVLAEAGLSFLGVGIKEPVASWGSLLAQGAELLPDPAVADRLARPDDPVRDARVQPARRRPQGRLRSALLAIGKVALHPNVPIA